MTRRMMTLALTMLPALAWAQAGPPAGGSPAGVPPAAAPASPVAQPAAQAPPGAPVAAAPPAQAPIVAPAPGAPSPAPVAAGVPPATVPASAASAPAQAPAPAPAPAPAETKPAGVPAEQLAPTDITGLLGHSVVDATGEEIGRVTDLLVDGQGRLRGAVIDVGGFMGVGNRKVAVAWAALRFAAGPKGPMVSTSISPDRIKSWGEYIAGRPVAILGSPGGGG